MQSLNNANIVGSYDYPSKCNKESLPSSYQRRTKDRNCLQVTKPPQSYSFRSIYSRVRTKITQSYFFRLIYPRVRTRITPKKIHIHNTQSNTKNFKECPKISTGETKTRMCINPYAQITPMSPRESASWVLKHISSESIRYLIF